MSTSVLGSQWKLPQPNHYQPKLSQEDDWSVRQRQQFQNRAGSRARPEAGTVWD